MRFIFIALTLFAAVPAFAQLVDNDARASTYDESGDGESCTQDGLVDFMRDAQESCVYIEDAGLVVCPTDPQAYAGECEDTCNGIQLAYPDCTCFSFTPVRYATYFSP